MKRLRTLCPLVLLPAAALLLTSLGRPSAGPEPSSVAPDGRVVVLGFDGADARTIRNLMAEAPGAYPTFEKLANEGTFAPLEVVAPPESPVSWAALNTGQNPAKTGVPGFILRKLPYPFPWFGHIETDKEIPIGEFENLPVPAWEASKFAIVGGGVGFGALFVLLLLVTRGKWIVALVLGLGGGAAGAYGGLWVSDLLPSQIPITGNPNQAENFWDVAAAAGVPSVVLDAAQAFDTVSPAGAKVLAGLGVPDARGGLGDWFIYTTDPEESDYDGRGTSTAGTVYRVDQYGSSISAKIYGPKNFWEKDRADRELEAIEAEFKSPSLSMDRTNELSERKKALDAWIKDYDRTDAGRVTADMDIEVSGDSATITIAGQTQTISVGEWSEFFELSFDLNWLLSAKALTRVRLVQTEPFFEVFMNVLDVDPREPPFWQPISSPHGFAAELAADCGLYETYGWPTTTMPVKDGEIDPELLMEDVEFTMKWRERLTSSALARDDWRILMSVFSTTDRVQHMMYQFYDTEHPLYDAVAADREMTFFGETIRLRDAIPAIYKHMDRVIGDVLGKLEANDTLLVCSDHGFQTFRTQFNVNNWLIENGYLAMKPGTTKSKSAALQYVDWAKTRVYSLGMGFLYVNQSGRENQGIVPASQTDALLAEVSEKLLAWRNPEDGAEVVRSVYITKEVHEGPFLDRESDAMIGFAPTYRVSWNSTSGGIHMVKDDAGSYVLGPVLTDNTSAWSGGHISVNLPDVAGVFFSNRGVEIPAEGVRALQIAPTVLDLVGVPTPAAMDLGPLTVR